MALASLLSPQLVFGDLTGSDPPTVLRSLADRLAAAVPSLDSAERLYKKLWEREQLGSTGIGAGVAIPHCKMEGIDEPVLAVGRLEEPIDYGAVDGEPVAVFFVVVSPEASPARHLQVLATISRWAKADDHVAKIRRAPGVQAILELLAQDGV